MQDNWLTDLLQTMPTEPTGASEITHASPDFTADHLTTSHASLTHSLEPDATGHALSMPPLDAPSWHHYPMTMYSPAQTASSLTTNAGADSADPNVNAWEGLVSVGFSPHAVFDPAHPGGIVVGNPAAAATHWQPQHAADSCVSAVQSSLIAEQTGRSLPETLLYVEAIADGVIQDHGTPAALAAVELQRHGVPAHTHVGGTIADLETAVAHGESVMVGVNAQAIAQPDATSLFAALAQPSGLGPADHAVEVTGFIHSPQDGHLESVVINDPGIPHGAGEVVPIEQFQQAWAASQNFYVATAVHQPLQAPNVGLGEQPQGSLGGMDFALGGSDNQPYVEFIGDHIWQHYKNGGCSEVGYVENQKFYSLRDGYCGKLGSDWNIYDAHGDRVGYVDSNLDVRSPNGRFLSHAGSAVGGAAWLLFVGMGGLS